MDRKTLTGFGLLALLLVGYLWYNSSSKSKYEEQQQHAIDSTNKQLALLHPVDTTHRSTSPADNLPDTVRQGLPAGFHGTAQTVRLENKNIALDFTSKGAFPVAANLKGYRTHDGKALLFFNGDRNVLSAQLPNGTGITPQAPNSNTQDLYFTPTKQSPTSVDFMADLGNGRTVDMIYTLPAEGYMLQCSIQLSGPGMTTTALPMRWKTEALHTEQDVATERTQAQLHYQYQNDDHDYYTLKDGKEKDFKTLSEGNTHWVGLHTHYFSTAIVSADGLQQAQLWGSTNIADSNIVARDSNTFNLAVKPNGNSSTTAFNWYIGPNDYEVLKSSKVGLEEMISLGGGIFFFVKYINKWINIPIFHLLHDTLGIANMGIIIILLTLIIRLLLSFFTYKSFLSSAKMRVLKPELDALRAKYGDDQQRFGLEQMKLNRSAGVNPLGGCLPTLFMMPFLIAMYYFFPTTIEVRGQSFLWAHDLSTYDSILNLSFNIPFYGNHVSLFTLLMTASSLFLALFNRNMTPQDPNNPMMKWMPFVFPILLIGVFNKMAAALTFYYFFSNMLSIGMQWFIQKFVIDEKKIHAQMQEARNKPATPSKWAARMEEMQKANAERMKQQPAKKK